MNLLQERVDESVLVVTFILGDALFGLEAARVQEVVRVGETTPVHHAPGFVAGIRNLRGRIVTVVDLRILLGLGSSDTGADSRILIVDWQGEPVGLLVDSVADTISLDTAGIVPPPPNVQANQRQFVHGVCRTGDRLVAMLDPGTVLSFDGKAAGPAESGGSAGS
jgi:purine-binding chemotaxis protein CheW